MDGRSQNFLTRKIDILEEVRIPKCPCGTLKAQNRNNNFLVKIMTKPDQALYYLTLWKYYHERLGQISWVFFSSLFSFQNHLPMLKGVKRVHIGPGCKDFFPFSLRPWFLSSYFESKPESSQSFHAFCEAETSNFYWILIRDPISWCQMSSSYMYILCSSCLPKALRQQLATYDKRFDGQL